MKFSRREGSRVEDKGWWVSPDNHIYAIHEGQSHFQWLSSHENIVKRHDETLIPQDPNIFEKAFNKGWIRIRIEFDERDMSKLIASISTMGISLLSTLPEEMKNVIASASSLEFIDMSSANTSSFNKEELMKLLHRQREASVSSKLVTANDKYQISYVLDPSKWFEILNKYNKACRMWSNLIREFSLFDSENFFINYEGNIDWLYNNFYITNSGGHANPNIGVRRKFMILKNDKTFDRIMNAIIGAEAERSKRYNDEQLASESLDARLEREKGEWEARNSSLTLSARDN